MVAFLVSNDASLMQIQRSLGRIEAEQIAMRRDIQQNVELLRSEFGSHKDDDLRNFSAIRSAIREEGAKRDGHLENQDKKLSKIETLSSNLQIQDDNTRAIGRWIIGAFGSLVLLVGTAVIAALRGHIHIN